MIASQPQYPTRLLHCIVANCHNLLTKATLPKQHKSNLRLRDSVPVYANLVYAELDYAELDYAELFFYEMRWRPCGTAARGGTAAVVACVWDAG